MSKCKHSYIMDFGGRIVRFTVDGLIEERIAGRGIYCIKCGHRYENPELLEKTK